MSNQAYHPSLDAVPSYLSRAMHGFTYFLSSLTVPQSPFPTFTSSPRQPIRSSISHSPFPHLRSLPYSPLTFPPWLVPSPVFPDTPKSDIPPSALLTYFLDHASTHCSSTHIYADGSKSLSGASFAVIFPSTFLLIAASLQQNYMRPSSR